MKISSKCSKLCKIKSKSQVVLVQAVEETIKREELKLLKNKRLSKEKKGKIKGHTIMIARRIMKLTSLKSKLSPILL